MSGSHTIKWPWPFCAASRRRTPGVDEQAPPLHEKGQRHKILLQPPLQQQYAPSTPNAQPPCSPVLCCVSCFGVMLCGADYPGSRTVPKGRGGDQRVQAQGRHGDRRCEREAGGTGRGGEGLAGANSVIVVVAGPPWCVLCSADLSSVLACMCCVGKYWVFWNVFFFLFLFLLFREWFCLQSPPTHPPTFLSNRAERAKESRTYGAPDHNASSPVTDTPAE